MTLAWRLAWSVALSVKEAGNVSAVLRQRSVHPWPVAAMLAAVTANKLLDSLTLDVRRRPTGCTGLIAWTLWTNPHRVYSVSELRSELGYRWSGRRVNSALQKLVAQGEVKVARLGNPKGYQLA